MNHFKHRRTHHHALAALALAATAGGAAAQSSVSIYGTIDAFAYTKELAGETKNQQVATGGMSTSNLSFRGSEDLGGGLSAAFDMSAYFQTDTGGAQRAAADTAGFWGKYAWVGLSSKDYGSIRMGRQTTPTFLNMLRFDPFGGSANFGILLHLYQPSGGQPLLTPNGTVGSNASGTYAGGDSAWNNTVAYLSPSAGGFSGMAMISAREGAAAPSAGGRKSVALFYSGGAFAAGLSADRIDNASGVLVRTKTDPTGAPYTVTGVRTVLGGMSYDLRVVKFFAQLNKSTMTVAAVPEIGLTTTQLGAQVPFGSGRLLASWMHTKREQSGVAGKKRETLSVGYDYDLSKRSDLYVVLLNDKATGLSSGTGLAMGIRHRF
ncbi:MAG: porin [Pseudomonadota bacterium]